jgi:hypothetical protein
VSGTEFECGNDGRGCGDHIFWSQIGPTQPHVRIHSLKKLTASLLKAALAFPIEIMATETKKRFGLL